MDGLTVFVTARLDEEERAIGGGNEPGDWCDRATGVHLESDRARRDVVAKRAILADHQPYDCTEPKGQRCYRCASDRAYRSGAAIHEAWPCMTLRHLASIWSDHADYCHEWTPEGAGAVN